MHARKSITPFAPNNVSTTSCPLLKMSLGIFSWLSQFTRAFKISGRNVEVIYSPVNYFEALKVCLSIMQVLLTWSLISLNFVSGVKAWSATGTKADHIFLSLSWNWGERSRTGMKQYLWYNNLSSLSYPKANAFHEALSDSSRPALKCTLVLDYLRGSRGGHNSRSMVQALVNEFDGRFQLCLYHTPNLRGFLKWIGPERFNEVMGLQHMKVYIFDNNLIISG